jgi:succinyl-diaminopimelate desuccinylase
MADAFCRYVTKLPYDAALQIVTDEENAGYDGTQYHIAEGVRSDFVICGESGRATDVYEIANEAKGIAVVAITFSGSSAHGAYPWRGENAAIKAVRFVSRLNERYPTPPEETGNTTITATSIISASDAYTKIPDRATVKLDARYVAGDPNFRSKEHYESLLKEIDPAIESIEFVDFSSPVLTNPTNPLLMQLKASAERIEGKPFQFVRRNATSDGRYFGAVGNEACEFGIAGEGQHSEGEYVPLEAIRDYHATMCDFLQQTIAQNVRMPRNAVDHAY